MVDVVTRDAHPLRADRRGAGVHRRPRDSRGGGARLHPQARQAGQNRAAGGQLDRHRPWLHRPRHARTGRVPALPDDRRELDQGTVPPLVSADLLRRSPPRAWRTARWPTSTSPSASCSTTAAPLSCRRPAPRPARSPLWPTSSVSNRPRRRELIRPPGTQAVSINVAADRLAAMVAVVQLVERQVVILDVAGSSPVSHPNAASCSRLAERWHQRRLSSLRNAARRISSSNPPASAA